MQVESQSEPESGTAFWSNLPGVKVDQPVAALQLVVTRRTTATDPEPRSDACLRSGH